MDLLKQVPGTKFGPDVVTWPALVQAFAGSCENFEYQGAFLPMSPLTLVASELGNLINPQDRDMLNLYINLWDGRQTLEKVTKGSGTDVVEAPWINLIGCTTPNWIADNMPAAAVGGGFTSRCIFVYADKKERFVPYVDEFIVKGDQVIREALIQDLERISTELVGPFTISPDARQWGKDWYERFWTVEVPTMDDVIMEGYAARKQTHMHKIAMVLSASRGSSRQIELVDMMQADMMLRDIEYDMRKVFAKIGRSQDSLHTERMLDYVYKYGAMPISQAYNYVHNEFPMQRDFKEIVNGAIAAGLLSQFLSKTGIEMVRPVPGRRGDPGEVLNRVI
jgi:hypothetical protein